MLDTLLETHDMPAIRVVRGVVSEAVRGEGVKEACTRALWRVVVSTEARRDDTHVTLRRVARTHEPSARVCCAVRDIGANAGSRDALRAESDASGLLVDTPGEGRHSGLSASVTVWP